MWLRSARCIQLGWRRQRIMGPPGERFAGRVARWIEDRRQLSEMDEHLLRDVGLTREDVARGIPVTHKGRFS